MIHQKFHPSHITPHFNTSSGGGAMEEPGGMIPLPGNLAAATPLTDDVAAAFFVCPTAALLEDVLSSRSLADVLRERIVQIETHGHTAANDAALPLVQFQVVVNRLAHRITGKDSLADRAKLRRKLVQLAAFILAFIDRIDRAAGQHTSSSEQAQ